MDVWGILIFLEKYCDPLAVILELTKGYMLYSTVILKPPNA
jgi:hypothetical protein